MVAGYHWLSWVPWSHSHGRLVVERCWKLFLFFFPPPRSLVTPWKYDDPWWSNEIGGILHLLKVFEKICFAWCLISFAGKQSMKHFMNPRCPSGHPSFFVICLDHIMLFKTQNISQHDVIYQVFHHQLHQILGLGPGGAGLHAGPLCGALHLGHGLRVGHLGEAKWSQQRQAGDACRLVLGIYFCWVETIR